MTQSLMLPGGTTLDLPDGVDPDVVAASIRAAVESELLKATATATVTPPRAVVTPAGEADNPEFGEAPRRVRFKLRGTQYDLPARLSVGKLKKLAGIAEHLPQEGQQLDFAGVDALIAQVGEAFAAVVGGSAGAELKALVVSEDEGLDFQTEVMPLFQYLMTAYLGARPLQGSGSSFTGTTAEPTSTPHTPSFSTDGVSSGA